MTTGQAGSHRLRVLIVDDDPNVRRGLRSLVDWDGLHATLVGEAADGREALSMVYEKKPDLVICDIKMPTMDGLELCKALHEALSDVSVVLLSAYEDFAFAQEAMRYGINDYILKPIDEKKIGELAGIIRGRAQKLATRRSFFQALHGQEQKAELFRRLKAGDEEAVGAFFDRELARVEGDAVDIKEWCLGFIGMLYDFLESLGVNPGPHLRTRAEVMNDVIAAKVRKRVVAVTRRLYRDAAALLNPDRIGQTELLVAGVKRHIQENFPDASLYVVSLAAHFGVSPNYLSHVFHVITGTTVNAFLSAVRIERARSLLSQPGRPLAEVALAVGFSDPHYFAKVFKKVTGRTPSEFRTITLSSAIPAP